MMAAALAKAVYLRRYLSDEKKEKKKKKKKSKRPSRFQIVDDDVDLKSLLPENSNNFLEQEDEDDAPTVAQFVDERPVHVRAMEEYQNTKRWKTVVEHKENQTDDNEAKRTLFLNNHISQHHCDKNQSPMGLENLAAKDGSCSQAGEGSGSSHSPRSLHGLDREAESKDSGCKKCFSKNVRYGCTSCGNRGHTKRQHKSSMQRRDCESSPSLQGISCGSDLSLSVQEHSRNSSDDDRYWSSLNSARNGSYTTAKCGEKISSTISCLPDLNEKRDSVERRELSVSANLLSHQPVPRKRHDSDSDDSLRTVHIKGLNSGGLCVNLVSATKECSSSLDPSGEKSHESGSDQSPPRRRRLDSGSDQSPLRNNNSGSNQKGDFGFDQSPTRKKRHDSGSDQSPQMRESHVSNQSKLNSNKDLSPPRRGRQSMQNRSRKSKWNQDLDIECSEKSQNAAQKSRPSVLYDDKGRPQKTLSGARAGLCSAAEMKKEAAVLREREEKNFKQLSDEVIGKNAETVFRTKSGSRRNLETERRMKKDDDERKAEADKKYLEWNKGLKQKEMQEQALVDHIHEMSKPLARYKDDKDLDKMLREDERDGDPMLAFIKRRKKDKTIDKPQYKGPAPLPNRFKIPPGYRWDGVDRSNGFEQKLFSHIADKRATAAIAYKWSIEEM